MKLKCDTCNRAMMCGIKEILEELKTQIENTSDLKALGIENTSVLKKLGIEIGCKFYISDKLV